MENRRHSRPPLHRTIAASIGYSVYFLSCAFYFLLSPLFLLLSFNPALMRRASKSANNLFLFFLTRIFLPSLRIYKIVEEPSFESLEKDSPAIFVANHRSRLDGPMLLPLLKNTGVLMKTSYARMPVFSFFVKHLDFVSVDSESVANLAAAIKRCKELFRNGSRLLIFPEGARSRSARMLPFKDLAFRLSAETGFPVVPLIVHCDHPFMAKMPGSLVPPFRMKFVVRSLPPMLPEENERPSDFAERVRRRMAEEIRILDKGTVWEIKSGKERAR